MRLFILFYLIFISIVVHSQISLNTTGAAPHPSAAWDIQYSDKGILIPRVNLTQTTSPSPITSPATSLLVFNEATVSDVSPGYYYWNGTRWIRLLGNDKAWLLEGNAGTNPSSNFLGTIDAVDLVFRTNNSERVRVTSAGNVGINTTSPAYRLTIAGTGDVFGVDNTATFFARNSSGNYEAYLWPRWSDNIMYLNYGSGGFHIRNNSSTSTMFMTNNNNVGIGTISPVSKLHVVGKTTLTRDNVAECCGNDATLALGENTQSTGRRASISFHNGNEAEGQIILIQNTLNGVSSRRIRMFDNQSQGLGLELTGRLWYGNSGTRTETRNDAGLQGNAGAQSGFYETSSPVNFPSGASSWWHLIDCRHSNNANNYAMQIAGSFFDQFLWYRKTNNNPSQPWMFIPATTNMGNAGQVLVSQGPGNFPQWQNLSQHTFGTNNQGVTGTTDINIPGTQATYVDIPQMSITFTPVHNFVYVFFTISGHIDVSGGPNQYVDIRILRNGTPVGASCAVATDSDYPYVVTSWGASLSLRVPVTIGNPTTINAQWRTGGNIRRTVYNNVATNSDWSHRSLIIID